MFNYLRKKVFEPIIALLRIGNSPGKIAHSVTLGVLMGVFPIYGTSTPLCFLFALIFRLNPAAIQLANYAMYAFQFILLIPFIQLGVILLGWQVDAAYLEQVVYMLSSDFWNALSEVGNLLLAGTLAWVLVSIPLYFALYHIALWYFKNRVNRKTSSYA
jgi:uncharacterized protein (DUF2062 family)